MSKATVLAKVKELKAEFDKLLEDAGRPLFVEVVQPLFEKHPEVVAVRWSQYIPAFCDGDPCVFGLGELEVSLQELEDRTQEQIAEDENNEDCFDEDFCNSYSKYVRELPGLEDTMDSVYTDLQELEDVCEKVFDSNAQITIKRGGKVTVDDYDCGY
jgi:hypothetical protein